MADMGLKKLHNKIQSAMLPSWGYEYNAGYVQVHLHTKLYTDTNYILFIYG